VESPCPYHFSAEEISSHRKDGEGFNEAQDPWDGLEGMVPRATGWTSHEGFDNAVAYFSRLRKAGLEALAGQEHDDFEIQTRWVLDHMKNSRSVVHVDLTERSGATHAPGKRNRSIIHLKH